MQRVVYYLTDCYPNYRFQEKGQRFLMRSSSNSESVDKIARRREAGREDRTKKGRKRGTYRSQFSVKRLAFRRVCSAGSGAVDYQQLSAIVLACSFHANSGITKRPVGISPCICRFLLFPSTVQGCSWTTTPCRWRNDRSIELTG